MKVHILEAQYAYEGSDLIGIYADKSMAEKKAARLRKAVERWQKAVEDDEEHGDCPPHIGSDLTVYSVNVIQSKKP